MKNCLFLLQTAKNFSKHIDMIQKISSKSSAVVLMADALLYADDERLSDFHLYALKVDQAINQLDDCSVQFLSYIELSDLISQFDQVLSLK